MTDTGQVPGEGQPENAGMVEQPGTPAPDAYTFLEPSGTGADEDDLLLMPGASGAWTEPQPGVAPAPPVTVPMPHTSSGEQMSYEQTQHEAAAQGTGTDGHGVVHIPQPPQPPQPSHQAPRRPRHMGPPMPDTGGVVRSLADRGPAPVPPAPAQTQTPAPMPVQGPPTLGPEYLDVPGSATQGGQPWAQQPAAAETVIADATGQFVPVEGTVPTTPHPAPAPPTVPSPRHAAAPQQPPAPQGTPAHGTPARGVPAQAQQPTAPVPAPAAEAPQPQATPAHGTPVQEQPAPAAEALAEAAVEPVVEAVAPAQEVSVPQADAAVPAQPAEAPAAEAVQQAPTEAHAAPAPAAEVPAPADPAPQAVPQAAAEPQQAEVQPAPAQPADARTVPPQAPEAQVSEPQSVEAQPAEPAAPEQAAPEQSAPEQVAADPTAHPAAQPVAEQAPADATPAEVPPADATPAEPVAATEPVAAPSAVGEPAPEAAPEAVPAAPMAAAATAAQTPAEGTPVVAPAEAAPAQAPAEAAQEAVPPTEAPAPGTAAQEAPVPAPAAEEPPVAEQPAPDQPAAEAPQAAPAEAPATEVAVEAAAQAVPAPVPTAEEAPVDGAPAEAVVPAATADQATADQATAEPSTVEAARAAEAAPQSPQAPAAQTDDPAPAAAEEAQETADATPQGPDATPQAHDATPQAAAADAQAAEPTASAAVEREAPVGPPAPGYADDEREAILRVMRERRDIRNGFRGDPIPHEVLLRVLEAAHTAPSVGHSQPWDFVVIRSAETRRAMHELAQRQRDAYAKSLPKGRAKQFKELKIEAILDTPVNIVVTADPTRGGRHTLGRHTQPQMAPYSSALAVENLWLAARAEGLGVGWVSFFDEREMVRALGLPEHLEVVAYLCVGYVDEFPEEPELMQAGWSKRRPLSWVVHEETYGRRALPGEEPHDLLQETVANIRPLDAKALGEAWERQKRMTKPAGALGMLEIISAQLCGLSRTCPPPIPEPAAVAIFAGDHGVHAQGVTAWPQEVTAQMVANFLGGGAVCNAFANQVGAEVCVVDVGVAADLPATPGLLPRKVRAGTADFTTGPALTRDEVLAAIEVGIETARDLVAAGNKAILTGEMGIANTTASAALISVYTEVDPSEVTGRGTGINDEMHARKVDVVRRALELHQPDPTDPIGVLGAVGGLEHAAMVGFILGGASLRTPVILDGVSAGAAALVARAVAPESLAACIAGHRSAEPGHMAALNKLGLRPLVDLDLRLGEGTGALLALPLVQSAARAMHEVATFDSAGVTEK
ncbi:nicotinate-nucleotide--dimethylbenzimidazole phosphoribosyltransferase [Streptomyces thermolilacinus]|uniref:nicotinate-nucleotide--dimethylbenzimidazole phosphoribosyltransferase n=1 Tax=Streptomyces thermolilacinus TaxID=285540 RepID=UPI00340B1D89